MANSERRKFLQKAIALTPLALVPSSIYSQIGHPKNQKSRRGNINLGLNAYSFNGPLTNGEMDLGDLLEFCSLNQLQAIDITAYYFPGYPKVPSDEVLYEFKRKAFSLGVAISGTGVRNNFSFPDEKKRQEEIALVKNWIDAAEKLGAPAIRIFSGSKDHEGYSWEEVAERMVSDIRECVEYGKQHGVVVALQNHHDFIQTADQSIRFLEAIDSDWFGLMLDIGSYRMGDPYLDIAKSIPYAVNWQIKEMIYRNGKPEPVDMKKLMTMVKESGYNGYLQIEPLGPGDPAENVINFLAEIREALTKKKG